MIDRINEVDVSTPLNISEDLSLHIALQLQILLFLNAAKPYYDGAIDGAIGPLTRKAFASFKGDVGLTPDKFLDADARTMLILGIVPSEAPGATTPLPADVLASPTLAAAIASGEAVVDTGATFGDTMLGKYAHSTVDSENVTHDFLLSILVRVTGVGAA